MRPCCAARSSGCCPSTTSTSPTGATRSWCRCRTGSFDLDDYIDYLIEFLETIGETTGERPHMLAVCQPSVPAFAATALMSADKNPWRPRTLTMMGGPIDTREAPTAVNTLATAAAVRLVPEQCHRDRADDLSGRGAEGLSGLPAARRLHDHEPRQPPHQPLGNVQASRRRRRGRRGGDPAISTRNIARSAT